MFRAFQVFLSRMAFSSSGRRPDGRGRPSRVPRYRPCVKAFEQRLVPSTVTFTNQSGGDWDVASNWSTHAVPGPNDDVTVAVAGTVTHSAATQDSVHSMTVSSTLNVTSGTLECLANSTISSTLTVSGGIFEVGNLPGSGGTTIGAQLTLKGQDQVINSGQILQQLNSEVLLRNGGTLTVDSSSKVTGAGSMDIPGGSWIRCHGTFNLDNTPNTPAFVSFEGTGQFDGPVTTMGGLTIAGGSVTFTTATTANGFSMTGGFLMGTGTVTIAKAPASWTGGTMEGTGTTVISATTTLGSTTGSGITLSRLLAIDGATATWVGGAFAMTAEIDVNAGAALVSTTDTSLNSPSSNVGNLVINGNGQFQKNSGTLQWLYLATFTNGGTLYDNSGTLRIYAPTITFNTNAGATVASGDTLNFRGNTATFPYTTDVQGGGIVDLNVSSATVNGTMDPSGGVILEAGSSLYGAGTLSSLTSYGNVTPGATGVTGTLSLLGNYVQESSGGLIINIGSATNYSVLSVGGSATLAGTLQVNLLNGYSPPAGTSFAVIVAQSGIYGDFSIFNIPSGWTHAITTTQYILTAH